MTTRELKEKYLKFFEERGHKIIPSASLIPENDPTVLFTTAGMHPLVPYLLGEKHPMGNKLVNVQKCIRTGDIDEVGDDWHLTFFEMLGNWGLGSYWKKEAIEMSFEFLTDKKWLGLDKDKISVSVFAGDSEIPKDKESAEIWKSLGIKEIKFLGKNDNFWGPAGQTGPCGPCTEMFYDGVEIWNDVFMEYNKQLKIKSQKSKVNDEYEYIPLKQKNVDTGMGVERTTAILNNKKSVYETDLFLPLIKLIPENAELDERKKRIIVDHIRAIVFLISDGVKPSNKERGYVLRRLIRRVVSYEYINFRYLVATETAFSEKLLKEVVKEYKPFYPELNLNIIYTEFTNERHQFLEKIKSGIKEYLKIRGEGKIDAKSAFFLYQTFGLPFDIIKELDPNKTKNLKPEDFDKEMQQHQELSRIATAGKFKSGLADNSEQVTKLHTATHLLLAALRKVLGEHVFQKGSNITAERLRLDFSHSEKMTKEQIKEVENLVNEQIKKDLMVCCEEMSLDEAKKKNAMGVFESKYGDRVKVYSVGDFSCEICSGPHVQKTGDLGHFKITKEEASSSGVRRIKAVLE